MGGNWISQWSNGTVKVICYSSVEPPALPTAVMITFDSYPGPTFSDGILFPLFLSDVPGVNYALDFNYN